MPGDGRSQRREPLPGVHARSSPPPSAAYLLSFLSVSVLLKTPPKKKPALISLLLFSLLGSSIPPSRSPLALIAISFLALFLPSSLCFFRGLQPALAPRRRGRARTAAIGAECSRAMAAAIAWQPTGEFSHFYEAARRPRPPQKIHGLHTKLVTLPALSIGPPKRRRRRRRRRRRLRTWMRMASASREPMASIRSPTASPAAAAGDPSHTCSQSCAILCCANVM